MAFKFPSVGSTVSVGEIEGATLVTAAETIAANDNDTTIPTSAATKAYADSIGGGISDVVDDTTPQLGGNLDLNTFGIGDAGDLTKEITFNTSGATTATTATVISSQTGDVSITLPDATTTLMGADTSDTMTNKTFDANGTGNSLSNVETADIAAGSKSGLDSTLVTGTSGTNGNLVQWNNDGDAVDASVAVADVVTGSSSDTFTNKTFDANGTGNSLSNVDVADLADGTDGELITWDASGNAATVAVGTSGHVLTSNGAGAAPTFQAAAGGTDLFDTALATVSFRPTIYNSQEITGGSGTITSDNRAYGAEANTTGTSSSNAGLIFNIPRSSQI